MKERNIGIVCSEYIIKKIFPCEFDKLKDLFDVRNAEGERQWEKYRSIRLKQFEEKDTDIYVIQRGERFIGELSANYSAHTLECEAIPNKRAYLSTFRLVKEYRRMGLGQRLLKFVLDDLTKQGYSEFTIGVDEDNGIAKHIYFKFGFTEAIATGRGDKFDPSDYTLYLKSTLSK